MTTLYIGNHTSSSKGYTAMAKQMIANGGNTFAFFTRNPRGGKAKAIDEKDIRNFLELTESCHKEWNTLREIIITFIRAVM